MARDDAQVKAWCRLTQCALAVERFRSAHNRLPESLSDLTPQWLPTALIDPFDGKPLRYRVLDVGYLIYSVGEDGGDDGGREREFVEPEYTEFYGLPITPRSLPIPTYDIVFACRRSR
jgi:hypothetical protein